MDNSLQPRVKAKSPYAPFVVVGLILALGLGVFLGNNLSKPSVIEITPPEPVLIGASGCGEGPQLSVPEVSGLTYSSQREGDVAKISVATISDRYKIPSGIKTNWSYDLSLEPCETQKEPSKVQKFLDAAGEKGAEILDGVKQKGTELWNWTKRYGPGAIDKVKDMGIKIKNSFETWSEQ